MARKSVKPTQQLLPNLKLVKAGPGAGKTHNMVNEVMSVLPNLRQHEICAIITHTNAAKEVIRTRISSKMNIPQNVFIGTIHSFLNEFLIIPFFLINFRAFFPDMTIIVPESIIFRERLCFSDNDIYTFKAEKKELQKGILHFRTSVFVAKELLKKPILKKLVTKKLKYLFVDEFQDIDPHELSVIEAFLDNEVQCYFTGDLKQKLMSMFTIPQRSKADRENPFEFLLGKYSTCIFENPDNHRSSEPIVDFVNNFGDIRQRTISNISQNPVYFISKTDMDSAYGVFNDIISKCKISKSPDTIFKVILAYSFKDDSSQVPIKRCSDFTVKNHLQCVFDDYSQNKKTNILELESYLRRSAGLTSQHIFELCGGDIVLYRRLVWTLYNKTTSDSEIAYFRKGKKDTIESLQHLTNYINKEYRDFFNIDNTKRGSGCKIPSFIEELITQKKPSKSHIVDDGAFYSTIHSFKGLEASCVLVVANSNTWLKSFIETDKSKQNQNSQLGYVAFSRAKDLLCIMCLEDISTVLRNKLISLNVDFL